jgi:hypothetical protein
MPALAYVQLWGSPSLLSNGYWGSFSVGKAQLGYDIDQSPQFSAKVKNEYEAISSIRNLRMRHAVVMLNMEYWHFKTKDSEYTELF